MNEFIYSNCSSDVANRVQNMAYSLHYCAVIYCTPATLVKSIQLTLAAVAKECAEALLLIYRYTAFSNSNIFGRTLCSRSVQAHELLLP